MNSNDLIFKTDLASLKYEKKQWLLYKKIFHDTQSSGKLLKTKSKEIYNIININSHVHLYCCP